MIGYITARAARRIVRRAAARVAVCGALFAAPAWQMQLPGTPRFVPTPCTALWGTFENVPADAVKCGTVTVPQDRASPNDPRLVPVVLPVIVYALPGAKGAPLVFLAGGPGESSIESVQRVFLHTPLGHMSLQERPIIAIDKRGYSPVPGRASPDLGTIAFEPRARRELAIAPLRDSMVSRTRELKAHGVDPRNFTTIAVVDDVADVLRALHYDTAVLFGVSYGTREALHFIRRYPAMVDAVVLDGVAPPSAPQLLDGAYVAKSGREVAARVVADCRADSVCAAQYADLPGAADRLARDSSILGHTARFTSDGMWRTLHVSGASVLSVLGIASSTEEVRASLPRMILEFAAGDTLREELSARVLVGAILDPSLQVASRHVAPIIYYTALCGDRPQGEPKAGDRSLCDALGVPFGGADLLRPVSSDAPVMLISSGYDAQTPAELADEAAKTLTHARRVHFATTGHVAFLRSSVAACVAIVVESFLRHPDSPGPIDCVGSVVPAFLPRAEGQTRRP